MNTRKLIRLFAYSFGLILFAATMQSCTLIDVIVSGFSNYCEGPFIVTKTEDTADGLCADDDCSLREAVLAANDCPGVQTIEVPADYYRLTLAGPNEDEGSSGDLDLTDPAIIMGMGEVIIDGQNSDRIFDFHNPIRGYSSDAYELSSLTVQNGFAESGGGGGMRIGRPNRVTLTDVVVQNNTAGDGSRGYPGSGGGLLVMARADAENLTVTGNTAYGQGGGVYVGTAGVLSALSADISSNRSLDNYGGGGVFNKGVAHLGGTFNENSSDWTGGGVHNDNSMTLEGATFNDNSATNAGGAIANTDRLEMREGSVIGNDAPLGGGLFAYNNPYHYGNARTEITDSSFEENTASQSGGGIFNSGDAQLILTRTDLYRNGADRGGGLSNMGGAWLQHVNVGGNTAGQGQGGGVYNYMGYTTLTHTMVAVNRAIVPAGRIGAAAIYTESGHVDVINTTISGHEYTAEVGGVIANVFGSMMLNQVTIANNQGTIFGGHSSSIAATEIQNSIVADNPTYANCNTALTSLGGNMFDMTGCGDIATDRVITPGSSGLDPLADNGGGTMTHALQTSSPAINLALDPSCQPTDQRTVVRPVGDHCDAGAYENESIVSVSGELPEAEPIGPTTCRSGPRSLYPVLGYLNEGETVQLLNRNEEASWLQVKSKDGRLEPCWVDVDLLDIPPQVDLPALELGYIPPEPTLTPEPEDELRKGCRVYDQFQNLVCAIPCPSENNQGVCYRE